MSISISGILTYSGENFYYNISGTTTQITSFPITINAGVTVTFGSNLTLTSTDQYFIIGGDDVTIDGAGYQVDFSGLSSYTGLIDGNSQTYSTIQNIGCINSSGTNQIISYISRGNFGASSSISNCYVICGGNIENNSGGIAGQNNSATISNCYVICGGSILGGGIAERNNSGSISNCYVICGGTIFSNPTGVSGGGIAGRSNSATISNCYVILGGNIGGTNGNFGGGGIASRFNSGDISNCYVICGGNINNFSGGIAGATTNEGNSGPISNCYVICGGNIGGGGIAGGSNSGQISNCYVSYSTYSGSIFASAGTITGCGSSNTPEWTYGTDIGAGKLSSAAWTNLDPTNQTPWLLSAFNTAIASSTTATSSSGTIALNTYGQSFANGSVFSGTQSATFTYDAGTKIDYSGISSGTYTLGLYANDLLSNLTFTFTFTYPNAINTAFNNSTSSVYSIVPYSYSVTDDVTLDYEPATITSLGTLTYNSSNGTFSYTGSYTGDINAWPITINAGVTVTFGSNIALTNDSQYFIINNNNVTIDGAGYVVNVPANYTGLVQNGTTTSGSGYSNCLVKSIGLQSSSSINIGIAKDYFGNGALNCSITSCYVICGGDITDFSCGIAGSYNSATISNCYVVCDGDISDRSGGIAGQNNSATISNCYVICGGSINTSGGIAGYGNSATISNCYVICGGIIEVYSGGIAGFLNSATISNCYVICGGNISSYSGGIAGSSNSGQISNCYVICGGDIINFSGGIAGDDNSATISNCYVICGGDIFSQSGGIAGDFNSATISNCYVSYNNLSGGEPITPPPSGTITDCNSQQSATPNWTSTGAAYLNNTLSAWTVTDTTKPWLLTAFNTAIASSTTATSSSGTIALNTYGQSFANGSVFSGTQSATFTYVAGTAIAYSGISNGTTYTLGLFGYNLLSNLTSFTFTNDQKIQNAYNYTGSSANNIVPYAYSVTDDVTLTYAAISNVCFQENTPIRTDQGVFPIEKLCPKVNTINNKKIVAITKTISQDKYLVCFEKDSLGMNYPNKSTTVTKQHKILYRGKMIEAVKFLGHFAGVKKVKYGGEVLYNVLMEKHELVSANNLLCETLHPQNIIARLYSNCMSENYKSKLTSLINESILKNDYVSYKKIVSRL